MPEKCAGLLHAVHGSGASSGRLRGSKMLVASSWTSGWACACPQHLPSLLRSPTCHASSALHRCGCRSTVLLSTWLDAVCNVHYVPNHHSNSSIDDLQKVESEQRSCSLTKLGQTREVAFVRIAILWWSLTVKLVAAESMLLLLLYDDNYNYNCYCRHC